MKKVLAILVIVLAVSTICGTFVAPTPSDSDFLLGLGFFAEACLAVILSAFVLADR